MGKFFTKEIKPTIAASRQTSAFASGDILFDWTSFDIPKGAKLLRNAIAISTGADGTPQSHAINLIFAKTLNNGSTAPGTLGTPNAAPNGTGYQNHLIGNSVLEKSDGTLQNSVGLNLAFVQSSLYNVRMTGPNLVLQGEANSGSNPGYHKLYVAGLSIDDEPNFASTVQVSTETATNTTAVVVKTTSALVAFDKGDVLHDEDDQLIGTIESITNATNIVLKDNCANVSAVNKDLYSIHPIRIMLCFEG